MIAGLIVVLDPVAQAARLRGGLELVRYRAGRVLDHRGMIARAPVGKSECEGTTHTDILPRKDGKS